MSQVQNLMQMIWNRANPSANAVLAADAKAALAGAQALRNDLLPIDPAPGGFGNVKPAAPSPSSFQAKVEESHAKLAAKQAKAQTPGSNSPDARIASSQDDAAAAAKADRTDRSARTDRDAQTDRKERNERGDEAERARQTDGKDKPEQAHARARKGKSGPSGTDAKADTDPAGNVKDTGGDAQPAAKTGDAQAQATPTDAPAQDTKAEAALKDRLEKMGITATDEQLSDPAFLKEVLRMLQGQAHAGKDDPTAADPEQDIPSPAPNAQTIASSPADGTAKTPAAPADAKAAVATDAPGTPAAETPTPDPLAVGKDASKDAQEPLPKDLAALIKDRLVELQQMSKNPVGETGMASAAAGAARAGASADPGSPAWRGLRLGRSEDTISTDPLPTADLDRLRILQAAALQAGQSGDSAPHPDQAPDADTETAEGIHDVTPAQTAASAEKSATAQDGGEDPNAFDQNQAQPQGMAFSLGKDGIHAGREGSVGAQFGQALDQVRLGDQKLPVERAWTPQQASFDRGILEQISKKMSAVSHLSSEEISIQLEPENLGKISVGLGLKDGVMTAKIGVENEHVRQIVEANLSNLRDTLQNQGIKLEGLEVSVNQRHSSLFNPNGSNSEAFFHQQGRGGEGTGKGPEAPPLESAPESETGRRWGFNTMEYIA